MLNNLPEPLNNLMPLVIHPLVHEIIRTEKNTLKLFYIKPNMRSSTLPKTVFLMLTPEGIVG